MCSGSKNTNQKLTFEYMHIHYQKYCIVSCNIYRFWVMLQRVIFIGGGNAQNCSMRKISTKFRIFWENSKGQWLQNSETKTSAPLSALESSKFAQVIAFSSLRRSQGRTVEIAPVLFFPYLSLSSLEFCPEISSETAGRILANKVSHERSGPISKFYCPNWPNF